MKAGFIVCCLALCMSGCINRTAPKSSGHDAVTSDTCSGRMPDDALLDDIRWDTTGMRFLTDNIDDDYRPETVVDTAINKFRIRYKVLYNDQLVPCYDTLLPDRSIFMDIQYKKRPILYKEYRVSDFPEIISAEESAKHALSGIYTISASDSTASFIMGYHVPDTDLGHLVRLTVTKDGEVSTTEVYWGEPGDSDIENSDTCSMHHAHDEVLANDIQWDSTGMRFLTDNIDDDFWPETVVDTAINNFRIRYKVLYNDQLVPCHDTLLPNRSVFLNVQYNKNLLLNREFRVTDFSDIIPVAECGRYLLCGMIQPESVSDSTVSFRLGYYIPDTDLGYPIMLTVTKEGKVLTSLIDEGELGEE